MQTINEIKKEVEPIFAPVIDKFKLKTYFSYYAVLKDGLMISLYKDQTIYLRISNEYMEMFKNHPDSAPLFDAQMGIYSRRFYRIPHTILSNKQLFSRLILSVIAELTQEKEALKEKKSTQIRSLPNMNINIERMLKKVGICSVQAFIEVGYLSAFVRLVIHGFEPTAELLFKLNGALTHRYIYTFTAEQKAALFEEADRALYESGLRKRFTDKY